MRELIGFAIIIALVGWIFLGWFKDISYVGYFYPDVDNSDYVVKQPGLKDLAACQSWVSSQALRDSDGRYDYECGKNCRPDGTAIYIDRCETTER